MPNLKTTASLQPQPTDVFIIAESAPCATLSEATRKRIVKGCRKFKVAPEYQGSVITLVEA